MLSLLLDENISPVVAAQIQAKRPDIRIQGLHHWHDGEYQGAPDETVLLAAHAEGLTLVTYDTQILSELAFFFAEGEKFGGLIFIDEKTVANNNFGLLTRALIYLWDQERDAQSASRLIFLPAPPPDITLPTTRNER